uniref:Uncharacterized protein n=1 Tax=viral metagenome TaxID=1070528 RepID=A0A6C0KG38_9ZZZZ
MDSFVADVFVFVFAVMLTLLSIGMVYRPGNASFFQASQAGVQKRRCNNESVSCQTHADCSGVCAEESMTCNQLFGGSSVCGPTTGERACNPGLGGELVFSSVDGDGGTFECLCTRPTEAAGVGCQTVNPGICAGPENAPYSQNAFRDGLCTCGGGSVQMTERAIATPFCAPIPADGPNWYEDNFARVDAPSDPSRVCRDLGDTVPTDPKDPCFSSVLYYRKIWDLQKLDTDYTILHINTYGYNSPDGAIKKPYCNTEGVGVWNCGKDNSNPNSTCKFVLQKVPEGVTKNPDCTTLKTRAECDFHYVTNVNDLSKNRSSNCIWANDKTFAGVTPGKAKCLNRDFCLID